MDTGITMDTDMATTMGMDTIMVMGRGTIPMRRMGLKLKVF